MKERRPSGEPALAEVGPPVILSLDVAGYFSVIGRSPALLTFLPVAPWGGGGQNGSRPARRHLPRLVVQVGRA